MKRIFAFICLKVVEILTAYMVIVQIPYLIGVGVSWFVDVEALGFGMKWLLGLLIVLFLLISFVVMTALFYEDDDMGTGVAIKWIRKNWQRAKHIDWLRK